MADIDPATPQTRDPSETEMEARTARFAKLVPYKETMNAEHGIPVEAMRMMSTEKVFPVMSPRDWAGRASIAPVKGAPGLIVTLAEAPPGDHPGLHNHTGSTENFFCLCGRFEISWGENGEHSTVIEPNDFISVPPGIYRDFTNVSDETGRLLVMIQPATGDANDEVIHSPARRPEIIERFGQETLEKMAAIGIKFGA
ncbi:unnamed protein product [Discosporangium mesarthrocarpum]